MKGKFNNVKIEGVASAVPCYVMDNMDYVDLFGKTNKDIIFAIYT